MSRSLDVEDRPDIHVVVKPALEAVRVFILEVCDFSNAALQKATQFASQSILLDIMLRVGGRTTLKRLGVFPQTVSSLVILITAEIQSEKAEVDVIAETFYPHLDRNKLGAIL
ncbi:MAG: hypothetical protein K0U40_03935 [Betaproteobacteria bacterium]|nr:hypothetical protein [Betaproteobacteria bacterium]